MKKQPRARPRARARSTEPLPVVDWITRKRDGGQLTGTEIRSFIRGLVDGRIPDYQAAALLMADLWRGMKPEELRAWLDAMVDSGDRLDLRGIPGRKVDKHSTGGVGDKVSLCLAPLVAACGVPVPMMAGRALGWSGGTIDKLEAIPGFRTSLKPAEFHRVLSRCGLVMAGQSAQLAPADRLLYSLRDATATVESVPLIASSILSKKIAEGADALVMDVKVGRGAFMKTMEAARELAHTIVRLGRDAGLETVALLTSMDEPLGREIGNASELREAIEILQGAGPPDTRALTLRLGAEMLRLGRVVKTLREGEARLRAAIGNGTGLDRLRKVVELQGGDPRVIDEPERLPRARHRALVRASAAGALEPIDAGAIGHAATVLGAGRLNKGDIVDPAVGITLHHKGGERVARGQVVATLWYNDARRLTLAQAILRGAFRVRRGAARPTRIPLVLDEIRS